MQRNSIKLINGKWVFPDSETFEIPKHDQVKVVGLGKPLDFEGYNKLLATQEKLHRIISKEGVKEINAEVAKKYLTPDEFSIIQPSLVKEFIFDLKPMND